jgi:hypothetical protein
MREPSPAGRPLPTWGSRPRVLVSIPGPRQARPCQAAARHAMPYYATPGEASLRPLRLLEPERPKPLSAAGGGPQRSAPVHGSG